jgi:hypothetical protein
MYEGMMAAAGELQDEGELIALKLRQKVGSFRSADENAVTFDNMMGRKHHLIIWSNALKQIQAVKFSG